LSTRSKNTARVALVFSIRTDRLAKPVNVLDMMARKSTAERSVLIFM
jgi:hypothetical protein